MYCEFDKMIVVNIARISQHSDSSAQQKFHRSSPSSSSLTSSLRPCARSSSPNSTGRRKWCPLRDEVTSSACSEHTCTRTQTIIGSVAASAKTREDGQRERRVTPQKH